MLSETSSETSSQQIVSQFQKSKTTDPKFASLETEVLINDNVNEDLSFATSDQLFSTILTSIANTSIQETSLMLASKIVNHTSPTTNALLASANQSNSEIIIETVEYSKMTISSEKKPSNLLETITSSSTVPETVITPVLPTQNTRNTSKKTSLKRINNFYTSEKFSIYQQRLSKQHSKTLIKNSFKTTEYTSRFIEASETLMVSTTNIVPTSQLISYKATSSEPVVTTVINTIMIQANSSVTGLNFPPTGQDNFDEKLIQTINSEYQAETSDTSTSSENVQTKSFLTASEVDSSFTSNSSMLLNFPQINMTSTTNILSLIPLESVSVGSELSKSSIDSSTSATLRSFYTRPSSRELSQNISISTELFKKAPNLELFSGTETPTKQSTTSFILTVREKITTSLEANEKSTKPFKQHSNIHLGKETETDKWSTVSLFHNSEYNNNDSNLINKSIIALPHVTVTTVEMFTTNVGTVNMSRDLVDFTSGLLPTFPNSDSSNGTSTTTIASETFTQMTLSNQVYENITETVESIMDEKLADEQQATDADMNITLEKSNAEVETSGVFSNEFVTKEWRADDVSIANLYQHKITTDKSSDQFLFVTTIEDSIISISMSTDEINIPAWEDFTLSNTERGDVTGIEPNTIQQSSIDIQDASDIDYANEQKSSITSSIISEIRSLDIETLTTDAPKSTGIAITKITVITSSGSTSEISLLDLLNYFKNEILNILIILRHDMFEYSTIF